MNPAELFWHKRPIRGDNQRFFAGRRSYLEKAIDAAQVPGAALAFYGDRGVGKTSLTWQLMEVLSGNHRLVERLKLEPRHPSLATFQCFWVRGSRAQGDLEGLILDLLTDDRPPKFSLKEQFPAVAASLEREIRLSVKIRTGLLDVEGNRPKREDRPGKLKSRDSRIRSLFDSAITKVQREIPKDRRIAVFIDELDRLEDRAGLGDLVKRMEEEVVFVLVGVADNLREIMSDHQSARRMLADSSYRLPSLSDEEVDEIFENVQAATKNRVTFAAPYRQAVRASCFGFPSLVQLLGYESLLSAVAESSESKKPLVIAEKQFDAATSRLATNDFERFREITEAVGHFRNREKILFELARHTDYGWMSERTLLSKLDNRGRQNFEVNIAELTDLGILRRNRTLTQVMFSDPLYRAVVGWALRYAQSLKGDVV